jgi:hypothetical protein
MEAHPAAGAQGSLLCPTFRLCRLPTFTYSLDATHTQDTQRTGANHTHTSHTADKRNTHTQVTHNKPGLAGSASASLMLLMCLLALEVVDGGRELHSDVPLLAPRSPGPTTGPPLPPIPALSRLPGLDETPVRTLPTLPWLDTREVIS